MICEIKRKIFALRPTIVVAGLDKAPSFLMTGKIWAIPRQTYQMVDAEGRVVVSTAEETTWVHSLLRDDVAVGKAGLDDSETGFIEVHGLERLDLALGYGWHDEYALSDGIQTAIRIQN